MKQCMRVKDHLMCEKGGKPCDNKDCAMVKMGYRAEDFEDTPTQQKIKDILSGMTDLLLYKNKKYGDSAINPKKIFYIDINEALVQCLYKNKKRAEMTGDKS